jgi:glycosyltransferase involved in cell wall biosynthesis
MRSLDAYASLHRSEGFGLTCAEAMATGIPVIATGYSGNMEFMNADNSLLVPFRVIETTRPYGAYPAGSRWAQPDADAAPVLLRKLGDRAFRESLGAKGRESVRRALDAKSLARETDALLRSLAAR